MSDAHPVTCPVCSSRQWRTILTKVWDYISDERFDIEQCESCGLSITRPMPSDDVIERYYSARYRGDRHAFTDRMRIALRARMLTRHFPSGFTGRFLDIGCGWGDFALAMRQRGWQVSVTEINASSLEKLRAVGIEAMSPDQAMRGNGFGHAFDAITCWHVLEHVMRPAELVRWARQVLAPNGLFQVTVPSLDSWQARLSGRHWLHLDVPRHRYHFTHRTLRRILEDNGFEITHTTTFAFEYDWFGWIQSALNTMCRRPNVLFEKMTSQSRRWPTSAAGGVMTLRDRADVALSCSAGPAVAAATLPLALLSWALRGGATLTMTAHLKPQAKSQPK